MARMTQEARTITLNNGIGIGLRIDQDEWLIDLYGQQILSLLPSITKYSQHVLWPVALDPEGSVAGLMQTSLASRLDRKDYEKYAITELDSFIAKIKKIRELLQTITQQKKNIRDFLPTITKQINS